MTETIRVTGVSATAEAADKVKTQLDTFAAEMETELEKKRRAKIAEEAKTQEEMEASIPKPVGYRVLIALPNVEETFGDSGLIKADQTRREEYILSSVGDSNASSVRVKLVIGFLLVVAVVFITGCM